MSTSQGNPKRRDHDIRKLLRSNHEVMMSDDARDFYVKLRGPADSPYSGGTWKVHVVLPLQYPYKSPSIGFCNPIFHPNVDEASGSVCLDVINQTWSPMYELVHIFETFLPQLLLYPNPSDPLNGEAAALLNRDPAAYAKRVKDHVSKHASVDIRISDSSSQPSSSSSSSDASNSHGDSAMGDGDSKSNGHGSAAAAANGSAQNGNSNGATNGSSHAHEDPAAAPAAEHFSDTEDVQVPDGAEDMEL